MPGLFHRSRGYLACVLLLSVGCASPPPARSPLKLTLLGLTPEAGDHLREDALDEYSSRTGIEVDLIPTPGTSAEQLPVVLDLFQKHSKSPDILVIDGTWPGTLHQDLIDLTPYLGDRERRHAKALLDNNTIRGRLIALPFYMNGGMLFYRRDLLGKYGFSRPPETWPELVRMALSIQNGERRNGKRSFWGYVWQGAAYEGLTCNALEWQGSFGGGHIVENDGSITIDNEKTRTAMRTAAGWIGSISPRSVLAYTESDTLNAFRAGNAAFMRHWSSTLQRARQQLGDKAVDVALLPAGPAGRAHTIGGFQLAVSAYSQHQREAAELVLFLTGIEVQTRRALRRGYLATYPELHRSAELLAALPQAKIFGTAPEKTWVFRPASITGAKYSEVSKSYYENIHRILSGSVSAEQALEEIRQRLHILIEGPAGVFRR